MQTTESRWKQLIKLLVTPRFYFVFIFFVFVSRSLIGVATADSVISLMLIFFVVQVSRDSSEQARL